MLALCSPCCSSQKGLLWPEGIYKKKQMEGQKHPRCWSYFWTATTRRKARFFPRPSAPRIPSQSASSPSASTTRPLLSGWAKQTGFIQEREREKRSWWAVLINFLFNLVLFCFFAGTQPRSNCLSRWAQWWVPGATSKHWQTHLFLGTFIKQIWSSVLLRWTGS